MVDLFFGNHLGLIGSPLVLTRSHRVFVAVIALKDKVNFVDEKLLPGWVFLFICWALVFGAMNTKERQNSARRSCEATVGLHD